MNDRNAIVRHVARAYRRLIAYTQASLVEAAGVIGGLIIGSLHPSLDEAATTVMHEAHERAKTIVQDAG
jgi:hypothetical protein